MQRAPSSSSVLLGLVVAFLLCLPLMLWWGSGTTPTPTTVELTSAEHLEPLDLSGEIGEIERDPIVYPEGPDLEWVVTGEEVDEGHGPGAGSGAEAPVELAGEGAPVARDGDEADEVAAYLREIDFALQTGAWWADSHAQAQTVLGEMMQGETGSLGDLGRSNAAVLERVEAMTPPPAARAHHRQTVQVLEDGIALLDTWQQAVDSGDLEAVAGFARQAEALKAGAARADALAAELRR